MDLIDRFVARQGIYVFDSSHQIQARDNFRSPTTQVSRLPGVPGGFDEFGTGVAPNEVGTVQLFTWIFGDTPAEVKAALDDLSAIAEWDAGRLIKQLMGNALDERWCTARCSSIDFSQNVQDMPHKRQRVQVNFQVADPYWYGGGTAEGLWDDGVATWGDGVSTWGSPALPITVAGLQNDLYMNVGGKSPTAARLEIDIPVSKSATNVRVQRIVTGSIEDEVRWNSTLAAGDALVIDGTSLEILKNGVDAYSSIFTFADPRWFQLWPGTNQIRVLMDNASDEIDLKFIYSEAYKK